MRLIKGKFILLLLAGSLFFFSCTPESCFEETEAYLKVSFYSSTTKKAASPDSLTVIGLGMQGKIYSGIKQITTARLPLKAESGSSGFVIKINTGSDTLLVQHSSFVHLISKDCGYTYFYNIDSLTISHGLIDSIWVMKPAITNGNEENLRIFY